MTQGWGGDVVSTSAARLAEEGLPAARTPGEVLSRSVGEARRELVFAETAARSAVRLQDAELEEAVRELSALSQVTARARLRLACDVVERGLHLGSGFALPDWLSLRCPDLSPEAVRDLARVAAAGREEVHRPLVAAAMTGGMPVARAAALHRALVRVRGSLSGAEYEKAVTLLVEAGCDRRFEDRDLARVIAALLRACLPEKDHDARARARRQLRDVHESSLGDGTVRRIVVTFGEDADYEAVRAVLLSPLSAPASREEQEATGVFETRTAGQRRYDALMTVLRRGVAGTAGQPTTPKATLVVTLDLETLRRDVQEAGREPGCGATLDGASIAAARIRTLACEADVIPVVLGGPSEVLDQGRRRRLVTPGQRLRLADRDKGCTIPGCTVPATWCDAHHVVPWSRGGRSDLDNYALLCPRHHTWVHETGFSARVTALGVTWIFRR